MTVYEEVGHGGASSVPAGVTEAISVDMGCVGEGLSCTERQVSICAKDSVGPYSYEVEMCIRDRHYVNCQTRYWSQKHAFCNILCQKVTYVYISCRIMLPL